MEIRIDPTKHFQTMTGFGASGAWWAQEVGGWTHTDPKSGKPVRERISELLYSEENGIGLTVYRYNIGAGSRESGNGDIQNPLRRTEGFLAADGSLDFSRDKNAVFMMKQAVSDGASEVILFVNSPPEALTKNHCAHTAKHKPFTENLPHRNYEKFADFCLAVTEHFVKEGVPVRFLSPVNEPLWIWNGSQEGCHYRPRSVRKLFRLLSSKLETNPALSGIKLSGAENGDIRWFNKAYTRSLLCDEKLRAHLESIDIHSYFHPLPLGLFGNRPAYLRRFRKWMTHHCPGVPVKVSEWTHMKGGRDAGMDSALEAAKIIWEDLTLLDAASWQHWIAVSEVDFCDGLLYIDLDTKAFHVTKRLFVTGQFSKYIRPGAVRVACECADPRLQLTAFTDNGSLILVAANPTSSEMKVSLPLPGKGRWILTDATHDMVSAELPTLSDITLPPRSVSTIVTEQSKSEAVK